MSTSQPSAPGRERDERPPPSDVLARAIRRAGQEFNLRRRVCAALEGLRALGRQEPLDEADQRCVVMAYQLARLQPGLPVLDTSETAPPWNRTA